MAMHTCQIILYGSPSPYDMDIHRIFDFDPIKVIVARFLALVTTMVTKVDHGN